MLCGTIAATRKESSGELSVAIIYIFDALSFQSRPKTGSGPVHRRLPTKCDKSNGKFTFVLASALFK